MTEKQQIGEVRQQDTEAKIKAKLNYFHEILDGNVHDFTPPKTISLNWFCSFECEELNLSKFSKSGRLLKRGTALHTKTMTALKQLTKHTKKGKKSSVSTKPNDYKELNKSLKMVNRVLAEEVVLLMQELENERTRRSVVEARYKDLQSRTNKTGSPLSILGRTV
jgi:hypothetical protein